MWQLRELNGEGLRSQIDILCTHPVQEISMAAARAEVLLTRCADELFDGVVELG
jgi:hypothetical protein